MPVVIGGDNLPSLVGIGLTERPNIAQFTLRFQRMISGQIAYRGKSREIEVLLIKIRLETYIILYYVLNFIYSEKTTKFCEISTNFLTGSTQDK